MDKDWIWHRLISTMGWQCPEWSIYFKMPAGGTVTMHVHPTWTVIGLQSLLEVMHGLGPPDSASMIFAGRRLAPCIGLSETGVQHESTIHVGLKLRGD